MSEKVCMHCGMAIPKNVSRCWYCGKKMPTSIATKITLVLLLFVLLSIIIGYWDHKREKEALQSTMQKCLQLYPNDADICVRMALGRGFKFDDVEEAFLALAKKK